MPVTPLVALDDIETTESDLNDHAKKLSMRALRTDPPKETIDPGRSSARKQCRTND